MIKKKRMLLLLSCGLFVAMISIHWTSLPSKLSPKQTNPYERNPPHIDKIWVQQLQKPINGNRMMVQILFKQFADRKLPIRLPVYLGENSIILYDDGTNGDSKAGDGIYTGTINEEPQHFLNDINVRLAAINKKAIQGGQPFITFAGHVGTQIPIETLKTVTFDEGSFNKFLPVPVNPLIITPQAAALTSPCGLPTIINQQSLFVTDLSVVEDPARTYNVVSGAGNPTGVWTFGTMISNMTGGLVTPSALLLSWFNNYMNTVVVNGQTIQPRVNFLADVIAPWEVAAGAATSRAAVTATNWLGLWNTIPNAVLLKTAPFKLTAIVNRIDLVGNTGFGGTLADAGETRFIFTLIDPDTGDPVNGGLGNGGFITGQPPLQIGDEAPPTDFLDWHGMNIIFEYGNVQGTLCSLINYAQAWESLSALTFPSTAYNAALENITDQVTSLNANPGNVNGSAIDRIRTNERINDVSSPTSVPLWEQSDWEFRQFQLDASSHLFDQVPLTNTPVNSANAINNNGPIGATNTDIDYPSFPGAFPPTIAFTAADQNNLMDWIFSSASNIADIQAGNVNVPVVWGGSPLLSGAGRVDFEYLHYLDLNWNSNDINFQNYIAMPGNAVSGGAQYKLIRQQMSLNTCQGCHAGETKTMFTQVQPMGYGTTAQYWNAYPTPPDFTAGRIDERFVHKDDLLNYPAPPNPENIQNVSAFLTGEVFKQPGGLAGYADDFVNASEDLTDNTMNGLYYVNAPDNYPANPINLPTYLFGYNDLLRRANNLATLACTMPCNSMTTTPLLQELMGIPLPSGGH